MKKKTFFSALAAFFLTLAFNAFSQDQASAPAFKDGEFWQFKAREWDWVTKSSNPVDGTYGCSYSKGSFRMFQVTGNQKQELNPTRAELLLGVFGLSNTQEDLKFPLTVGQKWNYQYKIAVKGTRKELSRAVEISVTGMEQVTMTAGTFRAFKLEKDDRSGPQDFWVTTSFYSPETKSLVKSFTDFSGAGTGGKREIELIKFGSASK